jgi:hypothetical protein
MPLLPSLLVQLDLTPGRSEVWEGSSGIALIFASQKGRERRCRTQSNKLAGEVEASITLSPY